MAKILEKIITYTDGGSRGNPGPAALGVVIQNSKGETIKMFGETLGVRTNNEAEYAAIVAALKKVKALFGKNKIKNMEVEMRMDSELAMKQLNGIYKVENEKIFPAYISILNYKLDFGKITFHHIPREKNKEADRMVNEALDGKESGNLFG